MNQLIPLEKIENRIYFIRNQRVMLDTDLAKLYGVETKALNRAVRRNMERFPEEFMFQLTTEEERTLRLSNLRYQFGTSSLEEKTWGGRRYLSMAFTEQGVAMLSAVLRSETAVQVSIEIMKAFVKLRAFLVSNKELAKKLSLLEKRYDHQFKVVFDAIRQMMSPPASKKRKIGFVAEKK